MNALSRDKNARGAWAEEIALRYLVKQGLSEVTRNYHCRYGEIDLILSDGDTVVFTEVRYRAKGAMVNALESISPAKQRRLLASAEHYLQRSNNNNDRNCRFDVIAMSGDEEQPTVQWIRNAIEA